VAEKESSFAKDRTAQAEKVNRDDDPFINW